MPDQPAKLPDSLESRAAARWQALIEGDTARAYQYLSPGTRQVYTAANYAALIRLGLWKSARVDKVECSEPDLCEVVVIVDYVVRGAPVVTPLRETWTRSEGAWWYVLK